MFSINQVKPSIAEPYGIDNGVFGAWRKGVAWDEKKFLKNVDRSYIYHPPIITVLPDIVGGGDNSIIKSIEWLGKIPHDRNLYIPVQDGCSDYMVIQAIKENSVAGLFLGGTTAFKSKAQKYADIAHTYGKKFHFARISRRSFYDYAATIKADSADSSQMLWSKEHLAKFISWVDNPPIL